MWAMLRAVSNGCSPRLRLRVFRKQAWKMTITLLRLLWWQMGALFLIDSLAVEDGRRGLERSEPTAHESRGGSEDLGTIYDPFWCIEFASAA